MTKTKPSGEKQIQAILGAESIQALRDLVSKLTPAERNPLSGYIALTMDRLIGNAPMRRKDD